MIQNHIHTDLTGGAVPGGVRIAAWEDGNFDELIIEFWWLGGSILRSVYHRGLTSRREEFIRVDSEEFGRLMSEIVIPGGLA